MGISNNLLNQAFRIACQVLEMFDPRPCSDRCIEMDVLSLNGLGFD